MTLAILCVALALLVAPVHDSRRRLGRLFVVARVQRGLPDPLLLAGLLCIPAFLVGGPSALIATVLLVSLVQHRRRRSGADGATQDERRKLLDGIEIVIGELRVGAHPSAACDTAAVECSGVGSRAFAVAAARSRLGGSAADGLRKAGTPVSAELERIAHAWRVAEEHGLALAELLVAVRSDLQGRMRFRGRTESGLAGARATGAVLAGLPLLGIGLGQLMGAGPLRVLLGGGAGGVLLVLGTAFVAAGLLWTDAITARVLR
ncbi:type II secretion system F family protein [Antrihabitans sp. YC2-6]|uniref:type II secretion system F family protein n=1 Tax=Antrihabitans sp. YC2-6 TaxID=2799498 RepID=UPI0018F378F8|nr:hypothetical protein [Antrihabitans sp. YC2-6]MBJ8346047.1 hypothetical protein [Antrihabitans sp. YC2-6]